MSELERLLNDSSLSAEARGQSAALIVRRAHQRAKHGDPPTAEFGAAVAFLETCLVDATLSQEVRALAAYELGDVLSPTALIELAARIEDWGIKDDQSSLGLRVALVLLKAAARFGRLDVFELVARDNNANMWLREMSCEVIGTRDPAGALELLKKLRSDCAVPPELLKLVDNAVRGLSQDVKNARQSPSRAEVVCASCGAVISYGPVAIDSGLDSTTLEEIMGTLVEEHDSGNVERCPVCGGTTRKMRFL